MSDYPKRIWIGSAAWFDRPYGNQQGYVREDLATAQDCILEVDRQARRIESLQRELKSANTEAAHYERFAKQAEARVEELLSRPAITPEMRERMRKALQIIEEHNITTSIYAETDAGVIFRDLLGEHGGMGDE